MNNMMWAIKARDMCEGYMAISMLVIENMTPDQLLLMYMDKKQIATGTHGNLVTGSPEMLIARGLLPPRKSTEQTEAEQRAARKQRRRERRAKLIQESKKNGV